MFTGGRALKVPAPSVAEQGQLGVDQDLVVGGWGVQEEGEGRVAEVEEGRVEDDAGDDCDAKVR